MAGPNTLTFTDAAFDQDVLRSDVPVLVDFWAEWCGPCRQIAPAIDALATEYAGKVKIGKLDVDSNGGTAMRYNVRGIPTLLLFKGGQVVEQRVGAVGKSELQKMIDSHAAATVTPAATLAPAAKSEPQNVVDTPVPAVKV
jgi:thioredoxin 1